MTLLLDSLAIVSLVVTASLVAVRNLRTCVYLLVVQQIIISLLYATSTYILAGIVNIACGVLVIPFLLYYAVDKTQGTETEPPIGSIYSTVILAVLFILGVSVPYSVFKLAVFPASFIVAMAGIGLYGLILRRDLVKITMALIILETAAHITLTYQAPVVTEIPVVGLLIEVMATFITGIMAFLIIGVYAENKTLDLRSLRRLSG